MKKIHIILVVLSVVMLLPKESYAQQESKSPTMVLKTNPMAALGGPIWVLVVPVTGEYRLMYEIKTTAKQSAMIGASYVGPSLILNLDQITLDSANVDGINTSGFKIQGAYKFYITSDTEAPEGFYLAPHFSYAKATISSTANTADNVSISKLNINALIGYQLISSGGFALDIYTGLGYKVLDWEFSGNSSDIFELGTDRAVPTVAFGLNFGYAF